MESTLQVLVLNTSLKKNPDRSNTSEVTSMVTDVMAQQGSIAVNELRIADMQVPLGLNHDMGSGDEWPKIADAILHADVIIFATPIWWGGRSSLMQRVIERMDSMDGGDSPIQKNDLLNKVAGIVITGSEDGAQAVMAGLMEFLSFMNFTMPPQCCTYWVGETGMDPKTDAERRRANPAVQHMADLTGKNLYMLAQALKANPLT